MLVELKRIYFSSPLYSKITAFRLSGNYAYQNKKGKQLLQNLSERVPMHESIFAPIVLEPFPSYHGDTRSYVKDISQQAVNYLLYIKH